MRYAQAFLWHFGHVKVAQFDRIVVQKYVCGLKWKKLYFKVAVQDLLGMQTLKPFNDWDEDTPDLIFFKMGFFLDVLVDFVQQVAVVGKFHYSTDLIN